MINLDLLTELGVSQKSLRAIFTPEREKQSEKVRNFTDRLQARIQEGIDGNVSQARLWTAIDRAVDSAMFAKSRTLFAGLLDNKFDKETVLSIVKEWGIDDWAKDVCGCGGGCAVPGNCQKGMKRIDIPAFFEVTFPIALAMKTVRVARIFNDRNLFPQFKYEPLVSTPEHRLKCDLVTHRVQVQAQQMEYKSVLRQVINQTCTYSICHLFPREAWWADQQPTNEFSGEGKSRKRKKRTVREGIRYEHPHPSRCYRDLAHPAYTFNSNTGGQYSGYWGLVRYGEVADNPDYWNTDKITFGKDSFRITDTNRVFFATVMPCQMEFPKLGDSTGSAGGTLDREEKMQEYTSHDRDCAVLLTNHFERLNPMRDLGLKNKDGEGYDGEVWFRFVVCSDDTVVYAEPLAYTPNLICLYDPDANKSVVTSLVQECIPTQDMVGNLLSQAILQAKNNLTNINFFNTDVLDQAVVDKIQNLGEKAYRTPQFIPYSKNQSNMLDEDRKDAVIPVPIQRNSIAECLNLIQTCLDILARGLVMSAQELGQTNSHEVTAQEVLTQASSTSTRLQYTASAVDDFIFAWQRQLHDAGLAYWDDVIFAEVALQSDKDKAALEKIGFKIETENDRERKVGVKGSKQKLELDMFTARRDAPDRVNSIAMATAMTNFFQAFMNNPAAMQIIGIDQFVDLTNGILDAFQFRKDWRLTAKADPFEEAKEAKEKESEDAKEIAQAQSIQAVTQQLQQLIPEIQKQTLAEVGAQLAPVMQQAAQLDAQQQQEIQSLQDVSGKLIQLLQGYGMLPQQPPQPATPPMQGGMPMQQPMPMQPQMA
jgi:hypothetical protein